MTHATTAVRVRVQGRVQGVWFRGWVAREAGARGLGGGVRNRFDGTVEALVAGPSAAVDDMVAACWTGPPAALVTDVTTYPAEDPGEAEFRFLPSG